MALLSCAVRKVSQSRQNCWAPHPQTNCLISDRVQEKNQHFYHVRGQKIYTTMTWWAVDNGQQSKLFIIPSLLTKEDTREMHFRQKRWRSLQLAQAQVTSPESVYWATPAYSYQCQPLSKCVGCWSRCLPASIHSNVCPWERPAIFSWPKGLNHTKVHACMPTHAHKCVHKIQRLNRTSPVWVGSDQLSAFMSVN